MVDKYLLDQQLIYSRMQFFENCVKNDSCCQYQIILKYLPVVMLYGSQNNDPTVGAPPGDAGGRGGHHDGLQPAGVWLGALPADPQQPGRLLPRQRDRPARQRVRRQGVRPVNSLQHPMSTRIVYHSMSMYLTCTKKKATHSIL